MSYARREHYPPESLEYSVRLARRITEIRESKKLTSFQLSARACLHSMTFKRIEALESLPDIAQLYLIATALQTPLPDLLRDLEP